MLAPAAAPEEAPVKRLILTAIISTFAASAYAQGPTCKQQADERKFIGAMRATFMAKCERDANKSCGIAATEKKYKGIVRTNYLKTCVADSVGGSEPKPTCKGQADEKKLAGAALTSFMTRCEKDATKSCDTTATEKKYKGIVKTNYVKTCVAGALGASGPKASPE
jgi:hypothetical protein